MVCRAYSPVHGYICVAICTFSIVTNLVHVLVLTKPNMRCSAVNCVLTAVATCDMGTMASYFIYICHFVLFKDTAWFVTFFPELWCHLSAFKTNANLQHSSLLLCAHEFFHQNAVIYLNFTSVGWNSISNAFRDHSVYVSGQPFKLGQIFKKSEDTQTPITIFPTVF